MQSETCQIMTLTLMRLHFPPPQPCPLLTSPSPSGSGSNYCLYSLSSVFHALSGVFWSTVPGALSLPGTSVLTLRPCRLLGTRHHLRRTLVLSRALAVQAYPLLKNQVQGQRAQRGRGRKKGEPQKNQNKTGNALMHLETLPVPTYSIIENV